jgi:hypothetical protein
MQQRGRRRGLSVDGRPSAARGQPRRPARWQHAVHRRGGGGPERGWARPGRAGAAGDDLSAARVAAARLAGNDVPGAGSTRQRARARPGSVRARPRRGGTTGGEAGSSRRGCSRSACGRRFVGVERARAAADMAAAATEEEEAVAARETTVVRAAARQVQVPPQEGGASRGWGRLR